VFRSKRLTAIQRPLYPSIPHVAPCDRFSAFRLPHVCRRYGATFLSALHATKIASLSCTCAKPLSSLPGAEGSLDILIGPASCPFCPRNAEIDPFSSKSWRRLHIPRLALAYAVDAPCFGNGCEQLAHGVLSDLAGKKHIALSGLPEGDAK